MCLQVKTLKKPELTSLVLLLSDLSLRGYILLLPPILTPRISTAPSQLVISATGLAFACDSEWHPVITATLKNLDSFHSQGERQPLGLLSERVRCGSEAGVKGTQVLWASEPRCRGDEPWPAVPHSLEVKMQ